MKTNRLFLPALLLSPTVLASPLAETTISFTVSEGATNTKTYKGTVELTLDSLDMTMNGQAPPMMPEMDMSVTSNTEIVVSDEYLAMRESAPGKLKRSFDTLSAHTDMHMEIDMMGTTNSTDTPMESASELEAKAVVFAWNEEEGEYQAAFPEEGGDDELLEGLEEDMDLREFLPAGPVEEGAEWSIPPSAIARILAPGGNLKLVPEEMDMDSPMGMNSNMGSMSDWFTESIQGEVTAKYAGTRDTEDGVKVAVIEVRVEVSNAVDLTEMVEAAMEDVELPPEAGDMDIDHLDLELDLTGEGTILWNLAAGRFQSMDLSGDLSMMMNIGMAISAQGMDMDIEQTIEMSGTVNQSASVR
jgi:hypothetical protein